MYQKRFLRPWKSKSGGGLGGLGSDLGMKILLEAALANCGQPRISAKYSKMAPSWGQDGVKMDHVGL